MNRPAMPAATGGVLSRIKPVKADAGLLRMSLYGLPKTGKTRLACSFPKPLLIIGSEDGTTSVLGVKGIDFVQLERCAEIIDILKGPVADGKYKSVVLDNGTKFRDMRISEILGLKELPVQKGWGFATRQQWGECANSIKELWRPLLDRRTPANVVIIAHEQSFTGGEDGGDVSSDLVKPCIGSALGKSLCDWVNAECDFIGNCYIREQTHTKQIKVGNDMKEVTIKTGKKEFCLRVGPSDTFITGFRLPPDTDLPDSICNPTYDRILQVIKGEYQP